MVFMKENVLPQISATWGAHIFDYDRMHADIYARHNHSFG